MGKACGILHALQVLWMIVFRERASARGWCCERQGACRLAVTSGYSGSTIKAKYYEC